MKSRSKICCQIAVPPILLFLLGIGCSTNDDSPAVRTIKRSMTMSTVGQHFEEAPLENGIAVLVDDQAAYWVKDGVAYTANEVARSWSPRLESAPEHIDFSRVRQAVRGAE